MPSKRKNRNERKSSPANKSPAHLKTTTKQPNNGNQGISNPKGKNPGTRKEEDDTMIIKVIHDGYLIAARMGLSSRTLTRPAVRQAPSDIVISAKDFYDCGLDSGIRFVPFEKPGTLKFIYNTKEVVGEGGGHLGSELSPTDQVSQNASPLPEMHFKNREAGKASSEKFEKILEDLELESEERERGWERYEKQRMLILAEMKDRLQSLEERQSAVEAKIESLEKRVKNLENNIVRL